MPTQNFVQSRNTEGYFWHPTSQPYFKSRNSPRFCFQIPNPELQMREISDPEKPTGDPPFWPKPWTIKQSSNLVPRVLSYPSLRSKRTWEQGWQSPTLDFFLFFNLFQLSTQVSSISQLPEWSCFLFCAIRLLLCVCFLTCLCRLIRKCDMTLKWTLIALKTVNQHNLKMIQQALNKMSVFEKFSFLVTDTQATSIFKNRVFSRTFVCTNFPFWQMLVCTQAQNGKDRRIFKQEHISVNVLKGTVRFSPSW